MTTFLSNREIYESVICGIVPQVRGRADGENIAPILWFSMLLT